MGDIKERKQVLKVILKNGEPLIVDMSLDDFHELLENNQFIRFSHGLENKSNIVRAIYMDVTDVENYILGFPKEIQFKLRAKQKQLLEQFGKEMTLSYAINFINEMNKKIISSGQTKETSIDNGPNLEYKKLKKDLIFT